MSASSRDKGSHPPALAWRLAYQMLIWAAFPLLWTRLWWRGRRSPALRHHWAERLGYGVTTPALHNVGTAERAPRIWIHAVSAGEVMLAVPLIAALLRANPGLIITLTTMTHTGRERAQVLLKNGVQIHYAPYDYVSAVRRFLRRVKPQLAVFVETELWPNTLDVCRNSGVTTLLVNARLSERSARGYARLGEFGARMLGNLDLVACQSAVHAARFAALGVPTQQLMETGSLKFDFAASPDTAINAQHWRDAWQLTARMVWVAGSTHAGEEQVALDAHRIILRTHPNALLLLVPRHPERAAGVMALGGELRAQLGATHANAAGDIQVLVVDAMGELPACYAVAQVAFVGGSAVPRGGHNPIEPAALGVPVLTGPSDFNFTQVTAAFIEAGALERVTNAQTLAAAVVRLFESPTECARRIALGKSVVTQHTGATERVCQLIERLLRDAD